MRTAVSFEGDAISLSYDLKEGFRRDFDNAIYDKMMNSINPDNFYIDTDIMITVLSKKVKFADRHNRITMSIQNQHGAILDNVDMRGYV